MHRWLPGVEALTRSQQQLLDPKKETLHILFTHLNKAKNGPSSSAAVGLALIQMASMWGLKSNYVIAGALDLRGRVRRVRGLAAKAEIAQKENITSMLYPEEGQVEALMEALDSPGLIVMKPRISLHTIWWR